MDKYDVLIVGAGILGLSVAFHIKRKNPESKILVIDKMGGAGQGNTERSASMFRNCFYSSANFALANTSMEFYKYVQENSDMDLRIRKIGYLWLFDSEGYKKVEPVFGKMKNRGLKYEIYNENELKDVLKLRTEVSEDEDSKLMGLVDVNKGVFFPEGGSIDSNGLVKFYESEFRDLGGKTQYDTKVEAIVVEPEEPMGMPGEPYLWQQAKATGVKTDTGLIRAKKVIIAAGAWSPDLLDQIGIETYIKPRKRQIFVVDARREELKELLNTAHFEDGMPFIILPKTHVYIKPFLEEQTFWLGYSDVFPRAFKLEDNPLPEKNFFEFGIYQVIVKYFPQFRDVRMSSSFAGLYAINTLDAHPVIFEEDNIIVVGGASGSGIMKADAIGRVAEALYNNQEYAELFGGTKIKVDDLGMKNRKVEREILVI